ncbi:hypothetical protein CCMSSC00406_0001302 [Pleurotus cornucopiae]|uniref:Uncharacterized protein n=1 Tax=Pleurotus cornucopiae TaxID=5321 RepID=A0ACB7ILH1_PLECO|nr:hypothetical protein CCMSSC00406_0001302 [Pleurotus cornucopiae]
MSPKTVAIASGAPGASPPARRLRDRGVPAFLVFCGTLVCLLTYYTLHRPIQGAVHDDFDLLHTQTPKPNLKQCPPATPPIARPPAPINLWAPLSVAEIAQVHAFLRRPSLGLNLTVTNAQTNDNSVFLIETHPPPKALALEYLSDPATKSPPERYARVVVHLGGQEQPVIKDYLVGPLPVSDGTTLEERRGIYHREDIPYNARGFNLGPELARLLGQIMPPLAEPMQALLGGVARGLPNDTLVAGASAPWGIDGSFRRAWISWKRNIPGSWINPLNLYLYVDMSGTDSSQYKVLKLVYDKQVFPSTAAFLEAFHNGTLKPLPPVDDPSSNDTHPWSSRYRPDPSFKLDLDHLPGPRSVPFAGLRFRVDERIKYVRWMGWGMYLGFDRDMGLSLWDIRFRNERIIYELAPQDALAQYSGTNPFQQTTAWLDRYFGMGQTVRPLMPSYDCPHDSVFLSANVFVPSEHGGNTVVIDRAICVFEMDTTRPITRHTGYGDGEFGAVKGYILVVRTISTVGNYDYHGTIEVRVSASGYLQGAHYVPEEDPYGSRIWHNAMGSLHDHVINFKVDLDILGTKNSLLRTTTSQEEVTAPWFDDDWGPTVVQQKITREYIENEDDALIKYPPNIQGSCAIVNQEEKNKWGTVRGYTIHPGVNFVHNTVVGSPRLKENANWARYNMAVSKRKDSEPSSSCIWNLHLPGKPVVNFHNFFDGENITQEDLVAWVNVGTHHLPQAEDAPNTRTTTATTSFFIAPLNYFDSDVSLDSLNAVLLTPPSAPGEPYLHDNYGVDQGTTCIPDPPSPFTYTDVHAYDMDGRRVFGTDLKKLQTMAYAPHRIMAEL